MNYINDENIEVIAPVSDEELAEEVKSFDEFIRENEDEQEAYRIVESYILQ